jgi:hypothetical protein
VDSNLSFDRTALRGAEHPGPLPTGHGASRGLSPLFKGKGKVWVGREWRPPILFLLLESTLDPCQDTLITMC